MNCKETKTNFTLFLEHKLCNEKKESFQEHLNSCQKCNLQFNAIKKLYKTIELEKKEEVNPFIFTRIQEKIKNPVVEQNIPKRILVPVISTVMFSAILAIGIWFGTTMANIQISNSYADLEMSYILNDLQNNYVESMIIEE